MRGRNSRLLAGTVTALAVPALIAGMIAGGSAGQPSQPERSSGPNGSDVTGTVTLLTGDRVRLQPTPGAGPPKLSVEPGPGRDGIGFVDRVTVDPVSGNRRVSVVPSDALELIGEDQLDRRLFDVTALLEAGYGDASLDEVPLIVAYDGARRARRTLDAAGSRVTRELSSIDAAAVRTSKDDTTALWSELVNGADGIEKVWLDGPVHASLDQSVPQVGAPKAWDAGFTGTGVKTAVLDTGIDATHPDLAAAVVRAKDFSDSGSTKDRVGHGTHVASIVTGGGQRYKGVAPDTKLLSGKVLDDSGFGWDSGIIAGMEWAVAQNARVVNLSLGGCATNGKDPLSKAVNRLTNDSGTLFVVAAGNHPSDPFCAYDERVSTPAAANQALAIGSVTKGDQLSDFSNIGPRLGDSALKPELTAPGGSIVAAKAKGTELGEPVGNRYVRASGTSMAAPHVAGAAAILAQQHPKWDADELRSALLASAEPLPELSVFQQGAGRLDVGTAVGQRVLTVPASLSIGRQEWPHADDEPVTKTVKYRNPTGRPVPLELAASGLGPDGEPAPDGMFAVSRDEIVVPAHGIARVRVTVDTSIQSPDGHYSGQLTANRGSELVSSVPIGVDKEVESYDLTLKAVDRAGNPTATDVWLTEVATNTPRSFPVPAEGTTLRLPKHRYDLITAIFSDNTDPVSITMAAKPELTLGRDRTVVLDARQGLPVGAEVDSESATVQGETRAWLSNGVLEQGIIGGTDPNSASDLFATPTERVTSYPYEFGFLGGMAEPLTGKGKRPRGYNLWLTEDGRIPDPPTFRVSDRELARHDTTMHGQGVRDNQTGRHVTTPYPPDVFLLYSLTYDVRAPGRRIDHYSAPDGMRWTSELQTARGVEYGPTGWDPARYEPGKRYATHWNGGPIGAVLRAPFAYGMLWPDLTLFAPSAAPHKAWLEQTAGVTSKFSVRKNGELLYTTDDPHGGEPIELPAEEATYEWRLNASRNVDWSTLGTQVNARWKITGGGQLPIPSLWISGDVDLLSRVPADRPFPVTLRVEEYDGTVPEIESIRLEASFDDGDSWRAVPVQPDGEGFSATVPKPPKDAEFGSFRAKIRGTNGSVVEQTVIRSYALK